MSKQFLGWDCANKTLAWSHIIIDTHIYSKISIIVDEFIDILETYLGKDFILKKIVGETRREILRLNLENDEFLDLILFTLNTLLYYTDNFIRFISRGVVDILEGRKVSDVCETDRTKLLAKWLNNSPVAITRLNNLTVIIEQQPSKIGAKTNNKSTMIEHQLIFYYIDFEPKMVNPKLKNNLELSSELIHRNYITRAEIKYKSRRDALYIARKLHSKDSFLYLMKTFIPEDDLKDIPKSGMDDLADSTMQILAYLVENNLFI